MLQVNRWVLRHALLMTALLAASIQARPVVYTLRTVADGKLGSYSFDQALVTFRLRSDTEHVHWRAGPLGGKIYKNEVGEATVSITVNGVTTTARFKNGEVFVRYDTGNGIAGFGSRIAPTYPVALGCDNVPYPSAAAYMTDCLQGDWGPLGGDSYPSVNASLSNTINGTLNGMAEAAYYNTPGDLNFNLPQDLSHNTLLTAVAHSCATTYTEDSSGSLNVCSGAASRGLETNLGDLYLQDMYGLNGFAGTQYSNSGSLQVEVERDEHDRED
jgi:hypothetical protein